MIAWVSHHLPQFYGGPLTGGAEMTDARLLEAAPEEVVLILPEEWEKAMEYEKVIITGTDFLSNRAMMELSKKNPVVAIHHKQTRSHARANLISAASIFICRTPRHIEVERQWTDPKLYAWCVSPLDTSELQVGKKENFALWAARLHPQKGPGEAVNWATEQSVPILMMHNKPRKQVLEAMSRAKHFVFFPQDFDAEPRAVIEAVLSGCNVITNINAGITSVPNWRDPESLRGLVDKAGDRFWELALN